MRIEFLGTGGFHPNERRHTTCLMVPEIGLILDCGTAGFRIAEHIETKTLDLLLSHAHLDHICGLTYLVTLPIIHNVEKMRLFGAQHVLDAVRDSLFSEAIFPVGPPFEFHTITPGDSIELANGTQIESFPLTTHPGGSIAYRFELDGQQIAYVTDTTVDGTYTDFIRGVDLLIHECYFPDSSSDWAETTGHTHSSTLAELAQSANVGRLVITHVDPLNLDDDPIGLDEFKKIYSNVTIADDGLTIDLSK
ncbi:MBL fold metallo-hydrolase [Thalassoglobus sp. JC818]|uniref:MBL fold metallo-hydrolase n=1 Tax=Thalassoglobus sp. JC818 TaxID=3232136 RepID=UPI0034593678